MECNSIMKLLLKTLWALSLVVFSGTYVFGQDHVIEQDGYMANSSKSIYFDMVDATDGYTSETGLSPTCTILYPGAASYASCPDPVTEIGTGTYRVRLSGNGKEFQSLGFGSLYITNAGARPARIKFKVIEDSNKFKEGASIIKFPSDFSASLQWTTSGLSVTTDTSADWLGFTIADTITGNGATSAHRIFAGSYNTPGGSRLYYGTVEVQSGTINNIWVGDENFNVGMDFNTSTGALSTTSGGNLRGWRVERMKTSPAIWRLHWLYSTPPNSATQIRLSIALGNGTVGTAPPSFASSGTMILARAYLVPAEGVSKTLLDTVLPNISASASGSSVTLDANEDNTNDYLKNREICFTPGYISTAQTQDWKVCSCIASYDGTTKVATVDPALATTLSTSYKYKIGGVCLKNVNASTISPNAVNASALATDAVTEIVTAIPKQRTVGR